MAHPPASRLLLSATVLLLTLSSTSAQDSSGPATYASAEVIQALYEDEVKFAESTEAGKPAITETEERITFSVPEGANNKPYSRLYIFGKEGTPNYPWAMITKFVPEHFKLCIHLEYLTAADPDKVNFPPNNTCILEKDIAAPTPGSEWTPKARKAITGMVCEGTKQFPADPVGESTKECRNIIGGYFDQCTNTETGLVIYENPENEGQAFERGDLIRQCIVAYMHEGDMLNSYLAKQSFFKILLSGKGIEALNWNQETERRSGLQNFGGQSTVMATASVQSMNKKPGYSSTFNLNCSNRNDRGSPVLGNTITFEGEPPENIRAMLEIPGSGRQFPIIPAAIGTGYNYDYAHNTEILNLLVRAAPNTGMVIRVNTDKEHPVEYIFPMVGGAQAVFKTLNDCGAIQAQ